MNIRILITLLILFFESGIYCRGQTLHIGINKEYSCFWLGQTFITNLSYSITNYESFPMWLWFNSDNDSLTNDSLKVRRYFKIRKQNADFSYYQLMCDGNVEHFTSSLFVTWGEVIQPQETFNIIFTDVGNDKDTIIPIIDMHMNIMPERDIIQQCPGVDDEDIKKKFTYNQISISMPWNLFYKSLIK